MHKYLLKNKCEWITKAEIIYNEIFSPIPWQLIVCVRGTKEQPIPFATPGKAKRCFERIYKNGVWEKLATEQL